MKSIAQFKRGDTFSLACTWKDNGVPTSVAGMTITSQLRTHGMLTLVESLTLIVGDQVASPGAFTLLAGSTSAWPVGAMVCDIKVSQDGVVRSSESFMVPVTEGGTR